MTWLNPWAALGLLAVIVPILVHLLARRRAKPQPFPTLRFLGESRLMLARRDRLTDLILLAVRCAVIAAAALALARPFFVTADRTQSLGQTLARAVIVDTSESMARQTTTGGTALEAANRAASRLTSEATTSTTMPAREPARALRGAIAWLDMQTGRRDIIVVSDFQTGALTAEVIAAVPAGVGIAFERVSIAPGAGPIEIQSPTGFADRTANISLAGSRTDVRWTTRARPAAAGSLRLLTGPSERARAEAALAAASAIADTRARPDRPMAIVFPGFAGRDALFKSAGRITEPWMFDVVRRLREDRTLSAAAEDPVMTAASGNVDGVSHLLLFCTADAGSVAAAALIAAAGRVSTPAVMPGELEPDVIPVDVTRGWERVAGSVATPRATVPGDASDGRWFWIAALVLLGVEALLRRRPTRPEPIAQEAERARVA